MSDYGRGFEFLQTPRPEDRLGRYIVGDTDVLIGAPVKVSGALDADHRLPLVLCTGATTPLKTVHGILIWEAVYEGYVGRDPVTTGWSDIDTAPAGTPVQLVSGNYVRLAYQNLDEEVFLSTRTYAARMWVAGIGIATPTVAVGDMLTPGTGTDVAGYWAETADATKAWLRVTDVDNDIGLVQAQMLF